jgi:hypothetical protein
MNGLGFVFALFTIGLMLRLPRRLAPLALLIAAAFISLAQVIEIGPFHFSVVRLLIAVGLVRVAVRGEHIVGGLNTLDRMMILWGIWGVGCLVFHSSSVLVTRLGELYDIVGCYFLCRVFVTGLEDIRTLFKMTCLVLTPLAALMLIERLKGINLLGLIGFSVPAPECRNGYFRAQGAFGHSILAGTVGAVCLPMALHLWRSERRAALAGLVATLLMVYSSGSSGPILTTMSVLGAMSLWRIRGRMRALRWLAVLLIVALDLVMNDPVYFLVARIDITGGSTGYFRAQLIRSAIEHLNEWWFAGTDYTRHWMATGISANSNYTDMTNHYLAMGVWGGLPLMFLFIGTLVAAFSVIGKTLRQSADASIDDRLLIWTLGVILFGHAVTFMSVSYFDQTNVFLYLALGCVGSLRAAQPATVVAPAECLDWSKADPEPEQCQAPS